MTIEMKYCANFVLCRAVQLCVSVRSCLTSNVVFTVDCMLTGHYPGMEGVASVLNYPHMMDPSQAQQYADPSQPQVMYQQQQYQVRM